MVHDLIPQLCPSYAATHLCPVGELLILQTLQTFLGIKEIGDGLDFGLWLWFGVCLSSLGGFFLEQLSDQNTLLSHCLVAIFEHFL